MGKIVKIEVKNCRSCCFSETGFGSGIINNKTVVYANCLAPYPLISVGPIDSYWKNYKSPKTCPLKKQSLKIEFKK